MTQHRIERVNEIIKEEIARVVSSEMKDPRIKESVIGVTRVKTTPDLKYAKVYVSILGEADKREEIMGLLAKASGFIRKNIADILTTRFAPQINFVLDESLDYAMHIESILKELNGTQSTPDRT